MEVRQGDYCAGLDGVQQEPAEGTVWISDTFRFPSVETSSSAGQGAPQESPQRDDGLQLIRQLPESPIICKRNKFGLLFTLKTRIKAGNGYRN